MTQSIHVRYCTYVHNPYVYLFINVYIVCLSVSLSQQVTDFLWPRWGLENGERLLELLHSDRFASRPLLVHAFSIGCYTFTQMLVHVSQDPEKYQAFTGRIKGHIYDSAVVGSVETMVDG